MDVLLPLVVALFATSAATPVPLTKTLDSVVPALVYDHFCQSTVKIRNLASTTRTLAIEGHRETGSLVSTHDHRGMKIDIHPDEEIEYKLEIEEETDSAWIKVRERIPLTESAGISITPTTDCLIQNQLRTSTRQVGYPMKNPWFSGSTEDRQSDRIWVINVSSQPVEASTCYSSGNHFAVPKTGEAVPPEHPICAYSNHILIPPFASSQFPIAKDGNAYFYLETKGDFVVLQALKPVVTGSHLFKVDSTITFGSSESPRQ